MNSHHERQEGMFHWSVGSRVFIVVCLYCQRDGEFNNKALSSRIRDGESSDDFVELMNMTLVSVSRSLFFS